MRRVRETRVYFFLFGLFGAMFGAAGENWALAAFGAALMVLTCVVFYWGDDGFSE